MHFGKIIGESNRLLEFYQTPWYTWPTKMSDAIIIGYRLYWGLAICGGTVGIGVTIRELVRSRAGFLNRLLALELAFLFTIASIFITELNRGGPDIYDQVTRISGMMGVCMLIITIPRFVNSRTPLVLLPGIDRIFAVVGLALLIHYVASSAYHFAVRYPLGKLYFDGDRVLPVFLAFFALAAAHTYLAVAFIAARPTRGLSAAEKKILAVFGLGSFAFIPLMLVFDNLRWMFPSLWAIHPVERFIVLPLFYTHMNCTVVLSIRANRRYAALGEHPGAEYALSRRESEVAARILDGLTQPQIAEQLFISLSTVQSHANSIYRKTGVNNKMQLANRLGRAGGSP
jgi:DNA-binding CsgD family transcriptional regulator